MSKKLIRIVEKAVHMASHNEQSPHYRHSCILLDKRYNILTSGCNNYSKTHPVQARLAMQSELPKRIFLHAEISALIRLRSMGMEEALHSAVCVRVRTIQKNKMLGLSFPCPICFDTLIKSGVKKIIYSTSENTIKTVNMSIADIDIMNYSIANA